jgi:hypothetical protein
MQGTTIPGTLYHQLNITPGYYMPLMERISHIFISQFTHMLIIICLLKRIVLFIGYHYLLQQVESEILSKKKRCLLMLCILKTHQLTSDYRDVAWEYVVY